MQTQKKISIIILIIFLFFVFFYYKKSNRIARRAKKYIGEEETFQNKSFLNKNFEDELKKIGWYQGAEWCSFFGKKIYLDTLRGKQKELASKLMSGSSQQTWQNFINDKSGFFVISNSPKKGALVIWQSKKDTTRGHVGIVTKYKNGYFETVEGNTNTNGSQGIVSKKKYNLIEELKQNKNLKLLGFIIPK